MENHPHTMPEPRLSEVVPGIWAYVQLDGSWFLNNCGFVVGNDRVVVIDTTSTEKRARAFHRALKETTALPVSVVVNTHYHADHTNGNFLFADSPILSHVRCREDVIAVGRPVGYEAAFTGLHFGDVVTTPPSVTFSDRIEVFAGDARIELIHVGTPAHTTGDVIAWLPEQKLLFTGDLVFNGGMPLAIGGSIAGWLEALDLMRSLQPDRLVPGHGEICGPQVFDEIEAYMRFVQEAAADMVSRGQEPLEYARQLDLGRFAGLTDPERIVANLRRGASEARGEPRGAPLSLPGAIQEMIEFNGGAPLRCYA